MTRKIQTIVNFKSCLSVSVNRINLDTYDQFISLYLNYQKYNFSTEIARLNIGMTFFVKV